MLSSISPIIGGALLAAAGASATISTRGTNASGEVELVSASWYAGWDAESLSVDSVAWDKYTHVSYAFGMVGEDPSNVTLLTEGDNVTLPAFVEAAHSNGVKALLSIGGWAGSVFFSTAVGSEQNRTSFISALQNITEQYDLDGLDFDWEFPTQTGIGCNLNSANDTSNFLQFLTELRQTDWASDIILTADVSLTPWADENGDSLTDVSSFANVLDWVAIMDYDVWGSWSTSVGPNAPLNDTCASTENQQGSAVSAVASWTSAGMPLSQVVLGVAAYGASFAVNSSDAFVNGSTTELAAYPPFDASVFPLGDAWDDEGGTPDVCGNIQTNAGTQDMWNLVLSGMLNTDGSPASDTPHLFDDCSQTDYIYNTTSGVMISYDSPTAFEAKGKFIAETGIRGFAMWETAGDYNTILLDAILDGAGVTGGDSIDIDACADVEVRF